MNKPYTPIPCEIYSRYELTILAAQSLRVAWRAPRGQLRVEVLRPLDLRTRRGGEYMLARDYGGNRRLLRLDRIIAAQPL